MDRIAFDVMCLLQVSTGASGAKGHNVFLIEKDGGTVSWCPDNSNGNLKASKMWNSLVKSLKNQFGKTLKIQETPIRYNDMKNVVSNDSINKNKNKNEQLKKGNIVMYWNLLKSSKESSQMYFYIGDLPKENRKRAQIISSKLMKNNNNNNGNNGKNKDCQVVMNFEDEDDWDENYKQLMLFLRKMYNFNNDEIDEEDYEAHPFKIYQVKPDDLDSILKEARSGNVNKFNTFIEEYDLDTEIEGVDTLEDFFDSNEDCNECGLYVSYKKYFLFECNDREVYEWVPSTYCIEDSDDMNWDNEFFEMKECVCHEFKLIDNENLAFSLADETEIDDGESCKTGWEELVNQEDEDVLFCKIVVTGQVRVDAVFCFFVFFMLLGVLPSDSVVVVVGCVEQSQNKGEDEKDEEKGKNGTNDVDVDTLEAKLMDDDNGELKSDKKHELEAEIAIIDGLLTNVDNEATRTNNIETDLEFVCDNLRKRQLLVNELCMKKILSKELIDALKIRFDRLLKLLKEEDYGDDHSIVKAIKKGLKACVYDRNLDLASHELQAAMNNIRTFDIEGMLELFNKTIETGEQVAGKDICLVLGRTGAGKSTTIHFLAGSTMRQDKSTNHISPVNVTNEYLKKIETEYRVAGSVTSHISGVPINLRDAGVKVGRSKLSKNNVTLCDSPGFDDTSGPEVDTANGLGIVRGVSKVNSAKMLVVLSFGDLDTRMKGMRQVAHTLAKIVPDFSDHLQCISFIFTKMPNNMTITVLKNNVKKAADELEKLGDNDDEAFMALLEYVEELAEDDIILLDPLKSDRREILRKIFKNASWMVAPKFSEFVTQASMNAIKQQILLHKASIIKTLNRRKHGKATNYELIRSKINELKRLNVVLPLQAIEESLIECVKYVSKTWNKRCEEKMNTIESSARSLPLNEFLVDIREFKQLLNDSKACEMLQKECEFDSVMKGSDSNVDMTSHELLELTLGKQMTYLIDHCTLDPKSKIYLDKAQAMVNEFENKFLSDYKEKIKSLHNDVEQLETETQALISDAKCKEFAKIVCNFGKIGSITHLDQVFDDSISIARIKDRMMKDLFKNLAVSSEIIVETFCMDDGDENKNNMGSAFKISDNKLNECSTHLARLKNARNAFIIPQKSVNENVGKEIDDIYNKSVNYIVEFCRLCSNEIGKLFRNENNENSVSSTKRETGKRMLLQLFMIRQFNDDLVLMKTSKFYYHIIEFIFGYFDGIRRQFDLMVDAIESNAKNINYDNLVNCVLILRESDWVFAFRDNSENLDMDTMKKMMNSSNDNDNDNENEILKKISDKLKKHVNKLLDESAYLVIDFEDLDGLNLIKDIMVRLKELKKLERLLPTISSEINAVVDSIQDDVCDALNQIKERYPLEKENEAEEKKSQTDISLNPKNASLALAFLDECKLINWINTPNTPQTNNNGNTNGDNGGNKKKTGKKTQSSMTRQVINTQAQVQQYILAYGTHTMKEMKNAYQYLSNIDSQDAGIDAMANGMILSDGLQAFYKIEKHYSRLLKYLNQDGSDESCLNEWVRKLAYEHGSLRGSLNHLASARNARLQIGVTHARALSKSDWFLEDYGGRKSTQFRDLYTDFAKRAEPDPDCQDIITKIDDEEFMSVQTELDGLKNKIDIAKKTNAAGVDALTQTYKNSRRILGARLREKSTVTKVQMIKLSGQDELEIETVDKLSKLFRVLNDAKLYCDEHLTEKDKESIKEIDLKIESILTEMMEKYENVALATVANNNFFTTEQEIKKIRTITDMLGSHWKGGDCAKRIITEVDSKINKIRKLFIYELEISNNAQFNPFSVPEKSPRVLYEKLKVVMKTHKKYQQLWQDIEDDLIRKFRQAMKECRTLKFRDASRLGWVLDQVLTCFPDHISKVTLKEEFKQCQKAVNAKKGEHEIEICLKENNYRKLNDLFSTYRDLQEWDICDHIKSSVKEQLTDLNDKIDNELAKSYNLIDREILFSVYQNIYNVVNSFGVSQSSRSQLTTCTFSFFSIAQKRIENKCNDASFMIVSLLSTPTKRSIKQLNYASQFIVDIVEKSKTNPNLFTKRVDKIVNDLLRKVKNHFKNLNKNFDNGLSTLDFTAACDILDTIEMFDKSRSKCELIDNLRHIDQSRGLKSIASYESLVSKTIGFGNGVTDKILSIRLSNNNDLKMEENRKKFYQDLVNQLSLLMQFDKIKKHTKIDAQKEYVNPCINHIEREISKIKQSIDRKLNQQQGMQLNEKDLCQINDHYQALFSISESRKILNLLKPQMRKDIAKMCDDIRQKITQRILHVSHLAKIKLTNNEVLVSSLIELEMSRNVLISFKDLCQDEINKILQKYRKEKSAGVAQLRKLLADDDSPWANALANEHSIFQGENISLFNKATADQGIDEVLKQIDSNDVNINKGNIKECYALCDKAYQDNVNKYLKEEKKLDLNPIVDNIEVIAKDARSKMVTKNNLIWGKTGPWNNDFKHRAIQLMANVFAIWTLQNSKHYFEAGDANDPKSYLMQPRVAQIVSIIRLLSIDDKGTHLVRNLVEIGTGEGKSLTLAVASCIMALLGFDVYCACYSQYLSRRDYQSFEDLFKLLRITNYIHYGTFNELCEQVINKDGNIREMVENMVLGKQSGVQMNKRRNRASILLIDEVDVFFNKDFYGNTYTPGAVLKDATIRQLTDLIWNNYCKNGQKLTLTFSAIKKSKEYNGCKKRFGHWMDLINEAIRDMMCDVQEFSSAPYIVKNDKIGYKESDRISFSKTLGYKTLFTYYHEHSKGNITQQSLHNKIAIYLQCGSFSYAEIPKNFYVILGVTGTLKTLSEAEQNIMKDTYKIERHTYMPSLFGVNKLQWKPKLDIDLFNLTNYHENLKEQIKRKINDHPGGPRCVFVCFETRKKLKQFYNSKSFNSFQGDTLVLTEEASKDEKNSIVKRAAISKKILLMTRVFGRGTDFQVHDKIVKNNGGPHVIQTFLSEQKSEEKQIMGRTARQGGYGSYSMVLVDSELEKYNITLDDIKEQSEKGELYEFIDKKRFNYFMNEYQETKDAVMDAESCHKNAQELCKALIEEEKRGAKMLLIEENRGAFVDGGVSKIAILMDTTGSMTKLINKSKNTVQTMFERVRDILVDNGKNPKSFQIQFISYKSYNAKEDLLMVSSWSSDPNELKSFLSIIDASFGQGDEALEVGLQHCNRLIEERGDEISCVIVIGDAPPTKTKAKVRQRRDAVSQQEQFALTRVIKKKDYWSNHDFAKIETYYKDETIRLANNGVQIHTCYVKELAKNSFEWIAQKSGGQCEYLDVNNDKGAKLLTDMVSIKVLNSCGGDKLVKQYEKKYMHTA